MIEQLKRAQEYAQSRRASSVFLGLALAAYALLIEFRGWSVDTSAAIAAAVVLIGVTILNEIREGDA